jgi:hypothetical protein
MKKLMYQKKKPMAKLCSPPICLYRNILNGCKYQSLTFESHPDFPQGNQLTKEILENSMSMGCDNMASNMRPQDNFSYQYDFVNEQLDDDDMAVRQTGALWGFSM